MRGVCAALIAALAATPPFPAPAEESAPRRIGGAEQVRVTLVTLDAVVRDREDRPVSGLTLADFRLQVDGVPIPAEAIETFEEICPARAEPSTLQPANPQGPASPAPAALEPEGPRHIVLYVDFSQLSLVGRSLSLRALQTALAKDLAPEERMMILAHTRGLRLVQPFTSDTALLRARLSELFAEQPSTLEVLEEPAKLRDVANRIEPSLRENMDRADFLTMAAAAQGHRMIFSEDNDRRLPVEGVPDAAIINLRRLALAEMDAESIRARRSLEALKLIMPALGALPGRKALILLTDSLRMEPGVAYASIVKTTPKQEGVDLGPAIADLAREANHAGIAFYTVHASGLGEPEDGRGDATLAGMEHATSASTAAITALGSALDMQSTLAVETGGRALQRTNDVGAILASARQDLSCYYLLGYRAKLVGDGTRHDLSLKLAPGPDGRGRPGWSINHRPYFTDFSPDERRNHTLRTALDVPGFFTAIPIQVEAFTMAPEGLNRRIIITASVPLERLTLIPTGPEAIGGSLHLRGELTGGTAPVSCPIDQEIPIAIARDPASGEKPPVRLVYETGCTVPPGEYTLTLAAEDLSASTVGATRVPLRVPEAPSSSSLRMTDLLLWSRDPSALVIASGAAPLGQRAGPVPRAWVPLAQRLLAPGQEGMLTVLACPPVRATVSESAPLKIRRHLLGEAGAAVAQFRPLEITDPPDPSTGCYQIVSVLPAGSLGSGVYQFQVRAIGPPAGSAALEQTVEIAVR